jgi:hypothetical protein
MSWAGDERKRRSEALERLGLRDASLWLGPPEGFPLARELGLKELLGELGAYRIGGGLLSHEMEWSAVHSLAGRYPRLRVVVESQVKKVIYHTRALFPLMRERPNVSIEISNFVGPACIEHAVREFGDDDRKMIASGNLNEIIEEAGH